MHVTSAEILKSKCYKKTGETWAPGEGGEVELESVGWNLLPFSWTKEMN